jgi:hypothetical protein
LLDILDGDACGADASAPAVARIRRGQANRHAPTEKKDNAPAFPEQTRAPFHDGAVQGHDACQHLEVAWSLAFLPSGNII